MLSLIVFAMLAAVHLDDKATIEAYEVEIVASERRLPPDMETQRAQSPETRPQPDLFARHGASKLAGS